MEQRALLDKLFRHAPGDIGGNFLRTGFGHDRFGLAVDHAFKRGVGKLFPGAAGNRPAACRNHPCAAGSEQDHLRGKLDHVFPHVLSKVARAFNRLADALDPARMLGGFLGILLVPVHALIAHGLAAHNAARPRHQPAGHHRPVGVGSAHQRIAGDPVLWCGPCLRL